MTCEHISKAIEKIGDLASNLNNKNSFFYQELGPYDESKEIGRCIDQLTGINFNSSDSMREALRRFLEQYKEVKSFTIKVIKNDALGSYVLDILKELQDCDCYNEAVRKTADKVGDIYQKEYGKNYNDLREKYNNLVNKFNNLSENSVKDFNNLKDKYNKLVDEYNDKKTDYHDMKEKYEDTRKELHSEKLKHSNEIGNERLKHKDESSMSDKKIARLEEKLEATSSQVIDLKKRLEGSEKRVLLLENKLDDKNNQLVALRLESGKKGEEIRELKNQAKSSSERAEKSYEDLLNEKIRSEKGNLELFATELRVGLEQTNGLVRYHERLF